MVFVVLNSGSVLFKDKLVSSANVEQMTLKCPTDPEGAPFVM